MFVATIPYYVLYIQVFHVTICDFVALNSLDVDDAIEKANFPHFDGHDIAQVIFHF